MGGNDKSSTQAIDASVGGLVWVRRRNGSWWPGRIVSLDEVNEHRLVSPKAGTPVKLLGRSDASVDWYNLEKSKRVKPFRCGEFDVMIEMAKAAAANTNKKAVKYARREDAILHALEIESSLLGQSPQGSHRSRENSCMDQSSSPREVSEGSLSSKVNEDMTKHIKACADESDSELGFSQSGISFEEPKHVYDSKEEPAPGKRKKTLNDLEDDGAEGTKRMRGLEDIGMGVVLQKVNEESSLPCDATAGNLISDGPRVRSSSVKRKRTRATSTNEVSKRKNRRRQLTKVMKSTAMVSVPVASDLFGTSSCSSFGGLCEVKVSGLEPNEEMKSLSSAINNSSDSTGASIGINKARDGETMSILGLTDNDSSERLFDVPFVAVDKHPAGISQVDGPGRQSRQSSYVEASKSKGLYAAGTTKWQLKRKRNTRIPSRNRKQDPEKPGNVAKANISVSAKMTTLASHYPCWNSGFLPESPKLYDVEVELEPNHKRQDVPLVLLTSRLRSKPIVGHPVTVEVLDNGYCDLLLSGRKDSKALDLDIVPGIRMNKQSSEPRKILPKMMKSKSRSTKSRKSASSSKKTKKLSSLTRQKPSGGGKNNQIAPQTPVVACIPVKLVFSRLNEALNRSAKQAHRAMPSAGI